MSVCQLKGVQVNTSQNQADASSMADAHSGDAKSSFGDQFPQIASIFRKQQGTWFPAGAPDPCAIQGFSRQGKAHPEGELNS